MKPEDKVKFIFNDVFWRCDDCNNIYSIDLKLCPNKMLDAWLIMDVVTLKELKELG
jgi:hypothetical protein